MIRCLLLFAVAAVPVVCFSDVRTVGGGCRGAKASGVFPLFDGGNSDDAEQLSSITAELFEDDETLRAREIAESFVKAKAAVAASSSSEQNAEASAGDDVDVGSEVTMVMDRAKEELNELKFQVGKVDEVRVRQLEAKEAEMQRMKFTILDLKEKIAESERKTVEAERKVALLQREGEGVKEENKGIIARIKEQFRKEKDELTNEMKSISEQLKQSKDEAAKELCEAKAAASKLESQLKTEVTELESELSRNKEYLDEASKEAMEIRERHRAELSQQKKEAARLQEASNRIAAQDKKELRNKTWELQTSLDEAKYDLMIAHKEIGALKAEGITVENKISDMQKEMLNTIADVKAQVEKEKIQNKKDTINVMANNKKEKYEALLSAGLKYDALVALNAQRLKEAEQAAEGRVRFARQEMNVRIKNAEKMFDREAATLKERNEVELLKVKADATSKINQMKKTLEGVEDDLARQEVAVASLQEERKSFRKIGRMALKLARERSSRLRDRVVNKIARRKSRQS